MSKSAIGFLALAITALAVAPTVAPAEAGTNHSQHIKKHKTRNQAYRGLPPAARTWPGASPPNQGGVCPGIARSFDCKIWPPPFDEDPDRKISGSDGA